MKKAFLVALKMDAGRVQDVRDLTILARDLGLTRPGQLVDLYEEGPSYLFIDSDKGAVMQTAVKSLRG